eukprot:6194720-Pleurochrysis_carterae.AAC.4
MLIQTLHRLDEYRRRRVQLDGVYVPRTVENVLGAKSTVSEMSYAPTPPYPAVPCSKMFYAPTPPYSAVPCSGTVSFAIVFSSSSDKFQLHLSCAH